MSIGEHLEAKMPSRFAHCGALHLDNPANGPLGSCLSTTLPLDLGCTGLAPVTLGGTVMARGLGDTGSPYPLTPALGADGRFRTP